MKKFLLILLVLIAVLSFSAKYGGVARYVMGADAVSLLPANQTDNISGTVCRHIFDGLVEFDEKLNITPALAERWEISQDGTEYTFYLRKGVKFHDGADFNAQAVKKYYDYVLNSSLRRTGLFKGIVKEIVVVDDYTVKFVLEKPYSPFLNRLAHEAALIVSPKAIDEYGRDPAKLGRNPVGTGPFMLKEWKIGERIELVKNPNYWREGQPYLDGIVFTIVPEDVSRVTQLRAGDVDVMFNPPPALVPVLQKDEKIVVRVEPSLRVIYIGFNTRKSPLNDIRVRQALNYAIDKQKLCATIMRNLAIPSDSPLAKYTFGYFSTGGYPYDPAKAKQLLKEAGIENLKLELLTPKGRYLNDYEVAVAVQGMLKEVGVTVDVKPMEWASYINKLFSSNPADWDYELFLLGWAPSTGEGHWVLYPLFHSDNMNPNGTGDNNTFYSNPKVDELIDKIAHELDKEKLLQYYAEVQKIIVQDAPWIFLYNMTNIVAHKKQLKNVWLLPTEFVILKYAWFE